MATGPVIGTAYVDVRGKTDKFKESTEKGVLSSVTDIAKKAALAFGAAFVVKKGFDLFGDAVAEAREANRVLAQTNQVILSTGGVAGVTAKHVDALANSLAGVTGIDDEAVASVENMLLTFTNVRNEVGKGNDVFDQATALALDMSKALGQDTKASAIQLGKALQDPILGVTALRRVGVAFTKDQQKQIKALVESGHALDAQKLILKELTTEFGGSAAAQATSAQKLKVVWNNIQEEIGKRLVPAIDAGARLLIKVLPAAFDLAGKAGARMLTVLRPVFREIGQIVSTFFDALSGKGTDPALFGFLGFVAAIGGAVHDLAIDLAGFATGAVQDIIDGFNGLPSDGGVASDFFTAVGDAARGLIDFFTGPQFAPVLDGVRDKFREIADLSDRVVAFFHNNETAAATAQAALAGVAGALAAIVIASKAIKTLNAVSGAVSGLASLLPALTNPAGLIAAGIVGLGVAAFVAYQKIQPFHDAVDATGRKLRDVFQPIIEKVVGFIQDHSQVFKVLATVAAGVALAFVSLAGALVVAYVKIKPFRDAVDATGRFLRDRVLPVLQDVAGFLIRNIPPAFAAVVDAAQTVARVVGPIFETIGRAIGDVFAFVIREAPAVGRVLADVFGGIVDIVSTVGRVAGEAFSGIITTVGQVADFIGRSAVFQFLVEQAGHFRDFIVEIAPQVIEAISHIFNAIGDVVGPAFKGAQEAIGLAVDQIKLVISTIVDVVRAVTDLARAFWDRWGDDIKRALAPIGVIVSAAFLGLRKIIETVLNVITFLWQRWGDDLFRVIRGVFEPIAGVIRAVVGIIANTIRLVLDIINGDWSKAWDAFLAILKAPVEAVKGILTGLRDVVFGILGGIGDTVSGAFHNAWDFVTGIVSDAVNGIIDIVRTLPRRLVDGAGDLVGIIGGLFGDGWDLLKRIVPGAVDAIVDFVKALPDRLADAASDLAGFVGGLFGDGWDLLVKTVPDAVGRLVAEIKKLPGRVMGATGDLAKFIAGLFGDGWETLKKLVPRAVSGIVDEVKRLPARILAAVTDLSRRVGHMFGDGWDLLKRLASGGVDAVVGFVTGFPARLLAAAGDLATSIGNLFGDGWETLKGIVPGAIDAIVGFVTGLPQRLLDAVGDLAGTVAGLFGDGWELFKGVPGAVLDAVVGFVSGLPQRITEAATTLASTVSGLFGTAWEDLKVLVFGAVEAIMGFITGLPDRIGTAAIAIGSAFTELGDKILHGIMDGLTGAADFAGDFAKAIGNAVIDVINSQIIDRVNAALDFTIHGPFGVNVPLNPPDIPHIPSLASGGIAPRNQPITATIGDNLKRAELIAPLPPGFLKAMEMIANGKLGSSGSNPLVGDVTIVESADGRQTFTELVRAVRASQFLAGVS